VTTSGFSRRGIAAQLAELLAPARPVVFDQVQPNPDIQQIERAGQELRGQRVDVVVGLGGGSAIDTAKALSLILACDTPGMLSAHLHTGAPLAPVAPLPLIAIPTTAGTGSEVTPFATIWDHQQQQKYSLARADLYPRVALIDPTLTLSLPADITIATGLDALAQGFEAIWNRNATPVTTLYALKAIALVFETLPRVAGDLGNLELRSQMLEASLLAGLAIAKTRTALSHSMSYAITARYGVPHGLACGFTLPAILEFNAAEDDGRLANLASYLGLASVPALCEALRRLLESLSVSQTLRQYIPSRGALIDLAPRMLTPGRSDNNLRAATVEDVRQILCAADFDEYDTRSIGARATTAKEYV
jgi:alcohol dehydrogenase